MSQRSKLKWPVWRRAFWVAALLLIAWVLGGSFVDTLEPKPGSILDFFQEYASARNLVGDQYDVYESQDVTAPAYLRDAAGRPVERNEGEQLWLAYNAHPPTAVLLAVPLAQMSYEQAHLTWNLMSLALLAAIVIVVLRALQVADPFWALVATSALMLLFFPLWNHLIFGQLSLVVALLVTAAWWSGRAGRGVQAGIWLGLATAIKVFPAFLFLPFLVRRTWSALIAGLVTLVLVTAATVAVVGTDTYVQYVERGLPQTRLFRSAWGNLSIWGFSCKLFHPSAGDVSNAEGGTETSSETTRSSELIERESRGDAPKATAGGGGGGRVEPWIAAPGVALLLALSLGIPLVATSAWLGFKAHNREAWDLAFSATAIAMLLASPVAWDHYLLILIAPAGVLLKRLRLDWIPETVLAAIVAWLALSVAARLTSLPPAIVVPLLSLGSIVAAALCASPQVRPLMGRVVLFASSWAMFLNREAVTVGFIEGGMAGTASPLASLTVLSTQFYALVAMFVLSIALSRPQPAADATRDDLSNRESALDENSEQHRENA